MLSLFPPPAGPFLPPFSSLFVQGSYHQSSIIYLAIGHVLQSSKHEALVISSSPAKFKQKLSSAFNESSSGFLNTNKIKTAMLRIIVIYPPSPAHLSLLISTLDGTQFASELTCLWAGLPVSPTENLSLIILDDISASFSEIDRNPPALSFISMMNRLRQTISRITTARASANPISVACFEASLFERQSHLEGVTRELFQLIIQFREVEVLSDPAGEKQTRKRISTWNGDEHTSIEYIERLTPGGAKVEYEFLWE
ncbi:hypothetical protein Agabi119p4_4786 [Agaricus bisporus var. burnettii]|uniref:Uncharacterized protein n=1 Tax=Agaricus bisporus var. burnettii TaxID=192524 RepID=A0A8H7F443_AGABI|nr:hypothetical protein Agabi119p4_4786 [Agaricus bisporus var. burnettii]